MSFFGWFNAELHQVKTERDWLRAQHDRMRTELAAERRRNLKREDGMLDQLMQASGGRKLPLRFEEDETPKPDAAKNEPGLTPQEEILLRSRAKEMLELEGHEEITNEMIEKAFQVMKDNADHYLTD